MEEEWKVVECNPNYSVSNMGEVMRITNGQGTYPGRISKPIVSTNYPRVFLSQNNKRTEHTMHTLVLTAFVGPRPEGKECNHKDGNKLNNCADNLEWISHLENMTHAYDIGIKSAKLKEGEVCLIKKLCKAKIPQRTTAKMFKVSQYAISKINTGKSWKHVQ